MAVGRRGRGRRAPTCRPTLEDPLRGVLAMLVLNTMIFSASPAERALARLRALGPGETDRAHPCAGPGAARDGRRRHRVGRPAGGARRAVRGPGAGDRAAGAAVADPGLENAGTLAAALATARRALALCDDDARARGCGRWLQAQLAGLARAGRRPGRRGRAYAEAALPCMEALGATEDLAQLRALLVVAAHRRPAGSTRPSGCWTRSPPTSATGRSSAAGSSSTAAPPSWRWRAATSTRAWRRYREAVVDAPRASRSRRRRAGRLRALGDLPGGGLLAAHAAARPRRRRGRPARRR